MNSHETEYSGLDTVLLMKFIDVFGIPPEMVPNGADFNDVVYFMKKNDFREECGSLSSWKNFVKVHDDIYFLLRIQRHLMDAKSCEYTYEMTVRILGIGKLKFNLSPQPRNFLNEISRLRCIEQEGESRRSNNIGGKTEDAGD